MLQFLTCTFFQRTEEGAQLQQTCWTCWPKHNCPFRVFTLVVSCCPRFSYLLPSRSVTFSNPLALLCFSLPSSNTLTLPILLFPHVFLLTFFPNCLCPQIPSLLLQLFASIKPLDRYLSLLLQHISPSGKACGRHASNSLSFWEAMDASLHLQGAPLGALVPPGTPRSVLYLSCSCAHSRQI